MKFLNRYTGQTIIFNGKMSREERSIWLLKKRLRDFENLVKFKELSVSFLTITQSDKSINDGYRWISKVMDAMKKSVKRSGAEFYYVAVLEIQPKRYRERGVLAPHWHIAIGCSSPELLPHGTRLANGHIEKTRNGKVITWAWLHENVKQSWGFYFCCDAYSRNIYNYLGKYLAKGKELSDFRERVGQRVRLFSSSRIDVKYQMTDAQAVEHGQRVQDSPELSELYCRREGSRIVFRAKEVRQVHLVNNLYVTKTRYPRISTIFGDWVVDHSGGG
jgi:hypothetical protein